MFDRIRDMLEAEVDAKAPKMFKKSIMVVRRAFKEIVDELMESLRAVTDERFNTLKAACMDLVVGSPETDASKNIFQAIRGKLVDADSFFAEVDQQELPLTPKKSSSSEVERSATTAGSCEATSVRDKSETAVVGHEQDLDLKADLGVVQDTDNCRPNHSQPAVSIDAVQKANTLDAMDSEAGHLLGVEQAALTHQATVLLSQEEPEEMEVKLSQKTAPVAGLGMVEVKKESEAAEPRVATEVDGLTISL